MDDQLQRVFDELASHAASAFEGMIGERPEIAVRESGAPKDAALLRRQPLSGLPGAIWIAATEADSSAAGAMLLQAAGLTETDPEKLKSEFLEIVNQTIAGVARNLSERLGREVRPEAAEGATPFPADVAWASVEVKHAESTATFIAGFEAALLEALVAKSAAPQLAQEAEPARPKSPTFDLLLDVELPISVSFGRAQVPLKDVLKLTTGSIIELNRAIGDPVEVIVNNCVIARGEVVTVEGNFGVRIHEVVSRQERWKSVR